MTWDPDLYSATIRDEIHDYDELQERVVATTRTVSPATILELGTGAGETARLILQAHPHARLTGIDSSAEMLRAAAEALPMERVELIEQDLGAPLPDGPFDLVVSALAIHHLEGERKAELFRRVAGALGPGGSFVFGDVIVPSDPSDAVIEIEEGYDFPSPIDQQLRWLEDAGFESESAWVCKDLAVFEGKLR